MKEKIKTWFEEAGFPLVGFLSGEDARFGDWLNPWLKKGYHGDMAWMEQHQAIRQDPASIEPWGKSFILLGLPYKTDPPAGWETQNPISRYAWGQDYHKVLKKMAKPALARLKSAFGEIRFRVMVDSAPLPEKLMAQRAGLGWIGKNGLLLHPAFGSYLFLGAVLVDLELESDSPLKNQCGNCRVCLDSCPTAALRESGEVDARRCISYLTIETKGEFTEAQANLLDYQLFGCDLCQQFCPFNHRAPIQEDSPFRGFERWEGITPTKVLQWEERDFEELKVNSPLKRAGLSGLKRNARAIQKD